jgi:hypothetical protein
MEKYTTRAKQEDLMSRAGAALYADVVSAGSLPNAMTAALGAIGSALRALDGGWPGLSSARVELGSRFCQIHIAVEERLFYFDCWQRGVYLAHGSNSEPLDVARAIDGSLPIAPLTRWLRNSRS